MLVNLLVYCPSAVFSNSICTKCEAAKYKSLSMVVVNIRDRPENIWFPKRMNLDKQHNKN